MKARHLHFDTAGADMDEVHGRTRWTMTVSFVAHALLLLFLIVLKPATSDAPALTEFTLVDPGELDAPAAGGAAAAIQASVEAAGARIPSADDESFRRVSDTGDLQPDPQTLTAADRVSARLAAMREDVSMPVATGTATGAPSALWSTPAGVPGGTGSSGQTISLTRGGSGGSGPALSLGRGGTGLSPSLAPAGISAGHAAPAASAPEGNASARRVLAGSELAGPIADRAILRHVTPVYPDWAKRDGVEAVVTLYFIVRADGSVKENILVQKTAGFGDFDDSARAALAAWRFEPLRGGRTGEQWGTITFHFRLRDA